jgi:SAM-dependent methyltransferase
MIDDWQLDSIRRAKAARIDPAVPNAARVADFLNGDRNNFEADRRAARIMLGAAPAIAAIVPAVLAFQQRAARFLAAEAGVRQFIDVGTGLPGVETNRDIFRSAGPQCRVVYVDNDPMVLSYVRAFSVSASPGTVAALDARLTDPVSLLAGAAETLDLRRPVAVLLPSTLPFIPSATRAAAVMSVLLAGLCPGSYLALCHVASDLDPAVEAGAEHWNWMSSLRVTLRSRAEVAGFVEGLDLLEPGLVPVNEWRPGPAEAGPAGPAGPVAGAARTVPAYAVVARKPGSGRPAH